MKLTQDQFDQLEREYKSWRRNDTTVTKVNDSMQPIETCEMLVHATAEERLCIARVYSILFIACSVTNNPPPNRDDLALACLRFATYSTHLYRYTQEEREGRKILGRFDVLEHKPNTCIAKVIRHEGDEEDNSNQLVIRLRIEAIIAAVGLEAP